MLNVKFYTIIVVIYRRTYMVPTTRLGPPRPGPSPANTRGRAWLLPNAIINLIMAKNIQSTLNLGQGQILPHIILVNQSVMFRQQSSIKFNQSISLSQFQPGKSAMLVRSVSMYIFILALMEWHLPYGTDKYLK